MKKIIIALLLISSSIISEPKGTQISWRQTIIDQWKKPVTKGAVISAGIMVVGAVSVFAVWKIRQKSDPLNSSPPIPPFPEH